MFSLAFSLDCLCYFLTDHKIERFEIPRRIISVSRTTDETSCVTFAILILAQPEIDFYLLFAGKSATSRDESQASRRRGRSLRDGPAAELFIDAPFNKLFPAVRARRSRGLHSLQAYRRFLRDKVSCEAVTRTQYCSLGRDDLDDAVAAVATAKNARGNKSRRRRISAKDALTHPLGPVR